MRSTSLLLGLLVLFLGAQVQSAPALPPGIISIKPFAAPALKLKDLDGKVHALDEMRGRWVFVHFWASWCGPCRREIGAIQSFSQKMAEQPLGLMLVNTAESEDTIFEFLAANAPQLNSLADADGLTTEAWHPRGLPATYLVDPHGMVRYLALGGRPWDTAPYQQFVLALIHGK